MGEHKSSKKKIIIAIIVILILLLFIGGGVYIYSKNSKSTPTTTVPTNTTPPPTNTTPVGSVPLQPPAWQCKKHPANNSANIVRRDENGYMECLGPDGKNCYWYANVDACNTDLSNQTVKTNNQALDCATNGLTLYGDLRGDPTNWCYTGRTDV